jgi:hypothetical protein
MYLHGPLEMGPRNVNYQIDISTRYLEEEKVLGSHGRSPPQTLVDSFYGHSVDHSFPDIWVNAG